MDISNKLNQYCNSLVFQGTKRGILRMGVSRRRTLSEDQIRSAYCLTIAVLGIGAILSVLPSSLLVKRNDSVQLKSATILYENRNEDALVDRILKYDDGTEQVLYARQNQQGGIDYLTGEQHEKW